MARAERTERFELRLSKQELKMLRVQAEEKGVSCADLLRMLIHENYKRK